MGFCLVACLVQYVSFVRSLAASIAQGIPHYAFCFKLSTYIGSMFNLFKKSDGVKVIDKVWMSKEAKWNACSKMLALNPSSLFVAWFEETVEELRPCLGLASNNKTLMLAQDITTDSIHERIVMFVEHYPYKSFSKN
jgi:hypothetical protein